MPLVSSQQTDEIVSSTVADGDDDTPPMTDPLSMPGVDEPRMEEQQTPSNESVPGESNVIDSTRSTSGQRSSKQSSTVRRNHQRYTNDPFTVANGDGTAQSNDTSSIPQAGETQMEMPQTQSGRTAISSISETPKKYITIALPYSSAAKYLYDRLRRARKIGNMPIRH